MCMPGDNIDMDVELITRSLSRRASASLSVKAGRTVGSGVVIETAEN